MIAYIYVLYEGGACLRAEGNPSTLLSAASVAWRLRPEALYAQIECAGYTPQARIPPPVTPVTHSVTPVTP